MSDSLLDGLIPAPRLLERDHIEVAATIQEVWDAVRHGNLAQAPLIRALFWLRSLPERVHGHTRPTTLRIDDLKSTPEEPGFAVLSEAVPQEFAVGAIGKVWQPEIPFVHVADAAAFAAFREGGFVKVAWSVHILPFADRCSRVELEVRVDATDDASWSKFETYFRLIGPGSHFIRRVLLGSLVDRFGSPDAVEASLVLPGDELLPEAQAQASQAVTIMALPRQIWPWLLQMGCRRAGYYSFDVLDNAGVRSSREVIPELTSLTPGQVIPAAPEGDEGFEVLSVQEPDALVLGGLYDTAASKQLPFWSPRPEHYWQVTWAFMLEPLNQTCTRLHVRARAMFPATGRLHATWIRPVHHFMQAKMLAELAARVEGRLPRDDWRDIVSGAGGAAIMLAAMATPFLRRARSHWGLTSAVAEQQRPGDHLVPEPTWAWTHGVEIEASAERVWRWVAQLGADRGGFYSYQWLENLVGCELQNADAVHPEWELREGDTLVLHPKAPPLRIAQLERGRHFVAHAPLDGAALAAGKPWAAASWLLAIEPLSADRCRLISRYRLACSADLATRLALGPSLVEPISFAMDRRMLLGIKQRCERESHYALQRCAEADQSVST
jgi:hypothetical protein